MLVCLPWLRGQISYTSVGIPDDLSVQAPVRCGLIRPAASLGRSELIADLELGSTPLHTCTT
jgi:hypothetical protein